MPQLDNIKYELYASQRAIGRTQTESYIAAGMGLVQEDGSVNAKSLKNAASYLEKRADVTARIAEIKAARVSIDKTDLLHELQLLDEEIGSADLAELYTASGGLKPVQDWPEVWRKLLVVGMEVESKKVRSHDGEDKNGTGGWDPDGQVVKLKFANRAQLLLAIKEMRGRHVDVGGFIEKGGDVNITIVSKEIDKRLAEGRKRVAELNQGRIREAEVIR